MTIKRKILWLAFITMAYVMFCGCIPQPTVPQGPQITNGHEVVQ